MFSRSKAGKPRGKGGNTYSFIGPEVVVTGDIDTPGQIHLDGRINGDVRCGSLTQGEGGAIAGNIAADDARLAGLIDGAVSAGTLLLQPTARVTGDVLYETLTVETGAQVDGRFKRRQGQADGSDKARAALAPPAVAGGDSVVQGSSLFAQSERTAEAAE
jgi:cytoskeletal protein CcmA (bactofilin family)